MPSGFFPEPDFFLTTFAVALAYQFTNWGQTALGEPHGGPVIAIAIAMSMVVIVIVGSMIGMLLPFILSRFNMDPATASTPLVTSIADATGCDLFFHHKSNFCCLEQKFRAAGRDRCFPRAYDLCCG